MTARELLLAAKETKTTPEELFPKLAEAAPRLSTVVPPPSCPEDLVKPKGVLTFRSEVSGNRYAAVYTDEEAYKSYRESAREDGIYVLTAEAIWALTTALRDQQIDGVLINQGDATELMLDRKHTLLLLREYALVEFKRMGGAWVPTKDGSLLVLELSRGLHSVPVFLKESDAQPTAERHGGTPQFHPWPRIRARCEEARADNAFAHFGWPEQMGLQRRHLRMLCGMDEDPLDVLEDAIGSSLGAANAAEIHAVLRSLTRVWVVVDADEHLVLQEAPNSGLVLDLFTTALHALHFIHSLNQPDTGLHPCFFEVKRLFSKLAPKRPSVFINRGCDRHWYGSPDTLPVMSELSGWGPVPPPPVKAAVSQVVQPHTAPRRQRWHIFSQLWDQPGWSRVMAVLARALMAAVCLGLFVANALNLPATVVDSAGPLVLGVGILGHGIAVLGARVAPQGDLSAGGRVLAGICQLILGFGFCCLGLSHL